ncbi:hypothetical protein [Paenibacillus sp. DS2015]|uniref:hypothetical protein n=1 Tax=Paenibacillus sp. DS2015 TaxID=3373917 RepID=UPI003D202644
MRPIFTQMISEEKAAEIVVQYATEQYKRMLQWIDFFAWRFSKLFGRWLLS